MSFELLRYSTRFTVPFNLVNATTVTTTVTATVGPDGTANTYVPNFYKFYARRLSASTSSSTPVTLTITDSSINAPVYQAVVGSSGYAEEEREITQPLFIVNGGGQMIFTSILPAGSAVSGLVTYTLDEQRQ